MLKFFVTPADEDRSGPNVELFHFEGYLHLSDDLAEAAATLNEAREAGVRMTVGCFEEEQVDLEDMDAGIHVDDDLDLPPATEADYLVGFTDDELFDD